MTNQLPLVLVDSGSPNEGSLQLHDGDTVEVGTARWFDWLEQNSSFRFGSGKACEHSFTARKHERESGAFWYAYRKLGKKLGNAYLGKSERLTVERMLEVASKLSQPKVEIQQLGYAKECITGLQRLGSDDDDSDPDLDDSTEPTNQETIKAQARKIQAYVTEIRLRNQEIQALRDDRDQLGHQLDSMAALTADCETRLQDSQQLPDMEVIRDHVLGGLRLGKQAPEYKRTKAAIDKFIAELRSLGS